MKIAEIKVPYSNSNPDKIQVTSSQIMYEVIMKHWDLNIIEYQEEVKVILLKGQILYWVFMKCPKVVFQVL